MEDERSFQTGGKRGVRTGGPGGCHAQPRTSAIRYVAADEDLTAEVARVMELFITDEPLLAAGGVSVLEARGALTHWMRSLLRCGLSVVAIADDDTDGASAAAPAGCSGRIVGALTSFAVVDGQPEDETLLLQHWFPHPAVVDIEKLIGRVESDCRPFERFGVDTLVVMGHMAVERGYRGAGVGQRLVIEALKLAQAHGYSAVVAAASGVRSQALFRRLSFDICGEAEYATSLDASVFDLERIREHRAMVLFAKDLRVER